MEYRRRKNTSDTWHFCTNCHLWPTSDYDTSYTKPTNGELCNHCKSKEASGGCNKR